MFDEIGYWSELKHEIITKYARAYTTVLLAQTPTLGRRFHVSYIDGFSGTGLHISKETGLFVAGSPLNALQVTPPFNEFHFVELNPGKLDFLRTAIGDQANVFFYGGDCNRVLIRDVFPKIKRSEYRRALCLLDPYGLHLDWDVIEAAGVSGTIEIFLNFPVMDMHMNAIWRDPDRVKPDGIARMSRFWGDETWRSAAYAPERDLFGERPQKQDIQAIVGAYCERLKTKAGFSFVPTAMPMRNLQGGIVYYLVFASPNASGGKIVSEIFERYRRKGYR